MILIRKAPCQKLVREITPNVLVKVQQPKF